MIPVNTFRGAQGFAKCFYGKENTPEGTQSGLSDMITFMSSIGTWDDSALKKAHDVLIDDPQGDHVIGTIRDAQGTVTQWEWAGRWGALGCPVVRMDRAWAASVCCSSIPEELFGLILPPWDSFAIDVPAELGLKVWLAKRERELSHIKIGWRKSQIRSAIDGTVGDGWTIAPCASNGDESPTPLRLRADQLFGGISWDENISRPAQETLRLVGPMIGAVCMAFTNREARRLSKKKSERKRTAVYPTTEVYTVGKPVYVDLSDRVATYVNAAGKARRGRLKIQGIVGGHWKNQPCGPSRSERKFIHIEPYWRGPVDAPIAVRAHILKAQPVSAE